MRVREGHFTLISKDAAGIASAASRVMTFRRIALALGLTALSACGGTLRLDLPDGAPVDGGSDAIVDSASHDEVLVDASCITPIEGAACSKSDVACPMDGDPCCIGFVWSCGGFSAPAGDTWTKVGLGCACREDAGGPESPPPASFPCGSTTCDAGALCEDFAPGIAPPDGGTLPDYFTCSTIPSECASKPTCDCIRKHMPSGCFGTCTVDASGNPTVHCMGA